MAKCDLSILFTSTEAWGLGITESKVLGIPVVASKIGGVVEQIKDRENGLLFELPVNRNDYVQIAISIKKLLEDKQLYNNMKNNLSMFTYDVEKIVDTMNECFFNKIERE